MQDKTSILAATTPQDTSTYHSFLINVQDPETGKRLFNVVYLIEVCKECRKPGKKAWKCTHKLDAMSGSKSAAKRKETMMFYRPEQKYIAQRELLGQQAGGSTGLLLKERIDRFEQSNVVVPEGSIIRCVYLGIDPGGGGPGELGIVGMVEVVTPVGPKLVVVLLASVSLKTERASDKERDAVVSLVEKLRTNVKYNVPIVAMVECAPGIQASHIEKYLRDAGIRDVCYMSERKGYIEGVPKTDKITEEYVHELQRALFANYITFASEIITYEKAAHKEKSKLIAMMSNLRREPIKTTTEYGYQKYKITAKVGTASPDDLLIALCMILYWRTVFWEDPTQKYADAQARILQRSSYEYPV